MPRVTPIRPEALPDDLAAIWRRHAATYGPFDGQLEVFAHVPTRCRAARWSWPSSRSRC